MSGAGDRGLSGPLRGDLASILDFFLPSTIKLMEFRQVFEQEFSGT
jgi:hypothetical protein